MNWIAARAIEDLDASAEPGVAAVATTIGGRAATGEKARDLLLRGLAADRARRVFPFRDGAEVLEFLAARFAEIIVQGHDVILRLPGSGASGSVCLQASDGKTYAVGAGRQGLVRGTFRGGFCVGKKFINEDE